MSKTRSGIQVEGSVIVLLHRVAWRFWTDHKRYWPIHVDDVDLRKFLEGEAEERAEHCIKEGYHSGELSTVFIDHENNQKEWPLTGWWEIAS